MSCRLQVGSHCSSVIMLSRTWMKTQKKCSFFMTLLNKSSSLPFFKTWLGSHLTLWTRLLHTFQTGNQHNKLFPVIVLPFTSDTKAHVMSLILSVMHVRYVTSCMSGQLFWQLTKKKNVHKSFISELLIIMKTKVVFEILLLKRITSLQQICRDKLLVVQNHLPRVCRQLNIYSTNPLYLKTPKKSINTFRNHVKRTDLIS